MGILKDMQHAKKRAEQESLEPYRGAAVPAKLTSENATHFLRCAQVIGHGRTDYVMRCHVLKKMPDGKRLKILVFGERNWRDREHISQIRYVPKFRVKEMPK